MEEAGNPYERQTRRWRAGMVARRMERLELHEILKASMMTSNLQGAIDAISPERPIRTRTASSEISHLGGWSIL